MNLNKMDYKKVSVLIVTYKQADVIGRNIESILNQRQYGLHEIVICDDCSPDNNWDVIQSYVAKYPDIIRAYRNETNLGIYGNSDKLVTLKGNADLFCWVEGDDAICDGFLKAIQDYISANRIDTSKRIGIFGNWIWTDPKGNERVISNKAIECSNMSPLSLYFREVACWRGSVFSAAVLDCFKPTILDKGLNLAETLFDAQFLMYLDKAFYIDICGTIYYSDIGISTVLGKDSSYRKEENIIKTKYLLDHFANDEKDKYWLSYNYHRAKYRVDHKFVDFYKAIKYYNKGVSKVQGNFSTRFHNYIMPLIAYMLRLR